MDVKAMDLDFYVSGTLKYQRTTVMRDLRNLRRRHAKAVAKADVCKRHDQRLAVDHGLVGFNCEAFVLAVDKRDLRASPGLGQPDVPHGGKLKFAQIDFSSLCERKGAGNGIYAG